MKALVTTFGVGLILLAFILGSMAVVAIFDPISAKMADDGDPFGTPPSRAFSAFILSASVALGIVGVYLIRRAVIATFGR